MSVIILPFDVDNAKDILRGKRRFLPWIKNFKRPVDWLVIALKLPTGLMAIGTVKVESKAFINKYTASDRIITNDGFLPKNYWYDYEDCHKVCLFRLSDRFVFTNPIPASELTDGRGIGSGVYIDVEIPETKMIEDEVN